MEKKISKKTLSKSFHHWYYGHLTCFSQEHMQTLKKAAESVSSLHVQIGG